MSHPNPYLFFEISQSHLLVRQHAADQIMVQDDRGLDRCVKVQGHTLVLQGQTIKIYVHGRDKKKERKTVRVWLS